MSIRPVSVTGKRARIFNSDFHCLIRFLSLVFSFILHGVCTQLCEEQVPKHFGYLMLFSPIFYKTFKGFISRRVYFFWHLV
ncbi:hypothetical protein CQZ94_08840 [Bacillus sp. MYb209]|nr:hypothetical protein CQZ94_08840 [Bacillus sp. MYb209]